MHLAVSNRCTIPGALCACLLLGALSMGAGCAGSRAVSTQWELTPSARLTFATLQLDQSIRSANGTGILEAVETIAELQPTPQPFVEAGAWFLLNKHMASARKVLEKGVSLLPDDLGLHLLLAESYLEDNQPDMALRLVQDYVRAHPKSDLARQELGILYLKANLPGEAINLFKALPESARSPHVRYYHAQALNMLKRYREAAVQFEKAVLALPDFIEAWSELARTYEQLGQPARALAVYQQMLDIDPHNQETWLRFINAELKAGNVKNALDIVQNGPENMGFQLTAATLLLDAKRYAEAEALLLGLQEEPGAPEEIAFYLAAIMYEHHKNPARTLEYLNHISNKSRFYDRALRFQVQLLFEQGRNADARAVLRTALEEFPDDRELRLMLAHLYTTDKLWTEAVATLDTALERWPDDNELLFGKGSILDIMGRKSDALAHMEAMLERFPENAQALNYVGYSLAEQNRDLDRALTLLLKADKLAPGKSHILDSLAWAQYRLGDMSGALGNIRRATNLPGSEEATIWDHYGDIAHANKLFPEARQAWLRALELKPDNADAIRDKLHKLP